MNFENLKNKTTVYSYILISSNPLLFVVIFCQKRDRVGEMHINCSVCSVKKVNLRTSIFSPLLKKASSDLVRAVNSTKYLF